MNEEQIERIGYGPTIKADIWALEQHIAEYRKQLNDEGIWLFLSTLGCWSVTSRPLQFFALALTALLFGFRLKLSLKEPRSFKALIQTIEARIDSEELTDTAKGKLFQRLRNTQNGTLSYRRSFKESGIFFCCWMFFTMTLALVWLPNIGK